MKVVFKSFSETFADQKILDPNATLEELPFDDLTDLPSPAATDLLIVELAAGGKRKVEIQNLPTGGTVADDSITNAKLANIAQNVIKARTSVGVGDPENLSVPVNTIVGHTTASTALSALAPAAVKVCLGYLTDLIDDPSPQLTANLDLNGNKITNFTGGTMWVDQSIYMQPLAGQEFGINNASGIVKFKVDCTASDFTLSTAGNIKIGAIAGGSAGTGPTLSLGVGASDLFTASVNTGTNLATLHAVSGNFEIQRVGVQKLLVASATTTLTNTSFKMDVTNIGFYGATPLGQQDITGSRANPEQALADLLASLATIGLITDNTTA
jgi:hypothetical protein